MKCREVKVWLYSFRPRSAWPADVVGHLQSCPACQKLHMDLRQIDEEVNALTAGTGDTTAKTRLLERVAKTPQVQIAAEPLPPPQPWPWLRVGAYLTGAAALFVFGWLLGRLGEPTEIIKTVEVVKPIEIEREKPIEVFRDKLVPVYSSAERALVEALVKQNARLVQTMSLKDRLGVLLDMADDCRAHVVTMIERGPRDQVPLTIELYGQLLREGVIVQLRRADERAELEATVKERLHKLATPQFEATELPRILEDQHEALLKAAADAAALLKDPNVPIAPRKWGRSEPMPATMALVQFALAANSETDIVARAERCAACVQRLTPVMMLLLTDNSGPARADVGQQFGEMIRFGVYTPLELATAKEAPQQLHDQADRIKRETAESIAEIEKNLEQAPPAVRPVLQRTINATQPAEIKGKGKGKGLLKKKASLEVTPMLYHAAPSFLRSSFGARAVPGAARTLNEHM